MPTDGTLAVNEYIFLMMNDATETRVAADEQRWATYMKFLRQSGQFDGGSEIGCGERLSKSGATSPADAHLTGYIRVRATSIEDAKRFLIGNPVYEAGGTVEIRELPQE